jgi:hypothetical protein
VRWESRGAARAWSFRGERGIEVVGLDDSAFVTVDALPGQMALVECATGCRESFAEAGIVLPVMASVRLGARSPTRCGRTNCRMPWWPAPARRRRGRRCC